MGKIFFLIIRTVFRGSRGETEKDRDSEREGFAWTSVFYRSPFHKGWRDYLNFLG